MHQIIRMSFEKFIALCFVIWSLSACTDKKVVIPSQPVVEMEYTTINKELKYGIPGFTLDLNKDNLNDVVFGVQLVGDPLSQSDKRQFFVAGGFNTYMMFSGNDESPVFTTGEQIALDDSNKGAWYNAPFALLVERVEHISGTITWNGNWLNVTNKYLAFQLKKNDQRYNGWIELSIDIPNQKIIVHRSAISKQPEKIIKAG